MRVKVPIDVPPLQLHNIVVAALLDAKNNALVKESPMQFISKDLDIQFKNLIISVLDECVEIMATKTAVETQEFFTTKGNRTDGHLFAEDDI